MPLAWIPTDVTPVCTPVCSQEPGWDRPVSTRITSTHAHARLLKAVTHFTDSDTEAGRHLGCSTPAQSRHRHEDRWEETQTPSRPGGQVPCAHHVSLTILELGVWLE